MTQADSSCDFIGTPAWLLLVILFIKIQANVTAACCYWLAVAVDGRLKSSMEAGSGMTD